MQDAGTPPLSFDKARVTVATAQNAQVQMLLASVMNWQPKHSAFSSLFGMQDKATPSSAMSFSPGLLGLLSEAKDSQA
jgi:hypothetical protein